MLNEKENITASAPASADEPAAMAADKKMDVLTKAVFALVAIGIGVAIWAIASFPFASLADESDATADDAAVETVDGSEGDGEASEADAGAKDGEDESDEKESVIDPDKKYELGTLHPSLSYSGLSKYFVVYAGGELRGAWGAPDNLPDADTKATWSANGDYVYDYWAVTVDKDGNEIFGGSPSDDDVTITYDQAAAAFERHMTKADWSRIGFAWNLDDEDITNFNISKATETQLNNRNVIAYEGTFRCGQTDCPAAAYVVLDGDTASWCLVIDNAEKASMGDLDNVRDAAERVAKTYESARSYIIGGNTPTGASRTYTTSDGSTIDLDSLGLDDSVQVTG